MPVQELQQKTTSTEFVMWVKFLEMQENEHSKKEYYWAQIAAEIRRSFVKNPQKIRMKDFLLKFARRKEPEAKKVDLDAKLRNMKARWFRAVGLKSDGTS